MYFNPKANDVNEKEGQGLELILSATKSLTSGKPLRHPTFELEGSTSKYFELVAGERYFYQIFSAQYGDTDHFTVSLE